MEGQILIAMCSFLAEVFQDFSLEQLVCGSTLSIVSWSTERSQCVSQFVQLFRRTMDLFTAAKGSMEMVARIVAVNAFLVTLFS